MKDNNIIQWAEQNFKHITLDKGLTSIQLAPAHKDVLNACTENDKVIVCGARQIGKTTLNYLFSMWYALTFDNKKISLYTYNFRTARYIVNNIKLSFDHIPVDNKPTIIKQYDMSLTFSNGSSITAYTYDQLNNDIADDCIICDEMAYSKCDDELIISIFKRVPKVIIMSSAYKNYGAFYDIWNIAQSNDNEDGWKPYMIKWDDIHSDVHTPQYKQKMIDAIGIDSWNTEFECKFRGE